MSFKVTKAREIAYDSFTEVMEQGRVPEQILALKFREHSKDLRPLDRAFIKELLFGSFRWYSKINWILTKTSKRDLSKLSSEVRAALTLGTYQVFYMDRVPDRAAVNESVNYMRFKKQASASGFVNGVLRSIARRAEYFAKPDRDKNPVEFLSLQYAHPRWIVSRWLNTFGFERTKLILSSNNKVPPLTIRVNCLKISFESIQELRSSLLRNERVKSEKRPLRSSLRLLSAPNFASELNFKQGLYTIQGEASQLIAPLIDPQENEVIIDACAGRGGKTGHIFELSQAKAKIFAVERDNNKLQQAREAMTRLGHEGIEWVCKDFLKYKPKEKVDKILLDSPCSGLGVLRRHPEGKWQKNYSSSLGLLKVQRSLIEHAISLLKPGGRLVYSVCSFELEETYAHLEWINKEHTKRVRLVSPLPMLTDYYKRFVTRENILVIYSSNKDDMDGFSAIVLEKLID